MRIGAKIEPNGYFPIRLDGLAAPDWNEPGAPQATKAIRDIVLGKWVANELDGSPTTTDMWRSVA